MTATSLTVGVYDADPRDLAVRLDRIHGDLATRGDRDRFRVFDATSRNRLLTRVHEEPRSVALIDLRSEPLELEASGIDLIETIRRHPYLHKHCHPVAWTAWASRSVADEAKRAGAYALIDDDRVRRSKEGVLSIVEQVAELPFAPFGATPDFRYLTDSLLSDDDEREAQRKRLGDALGENPGTADADILAGHAQGLDTHEIADRLRVARKTVQRRLGHMRAVLRQSALTRGRDDPYTIRTVIASGAPPFLPPRHRLDRRPDPWQAARWWQDNECRRLAFFAEDELEALAIYFEAVKDLPTPAAGQPGAPAIGRHKMERESQLNEAVASRLREHRTGRVVPDEVGVTLTRGLVNLTWAAQELATERPAAAGP